MPYGGDRRSITESELDARARDAIRFATKALARRGVAAIILPSFTPPAY